uniref:Uncharacterized protein n=1 Tax=Anguilla anguilla TaxID=7936 RepID=A0A0E9S637_ANGAN
MSMELCFLLHAINVLV